jgi:hypothetical protein
MPNTILKLTIRDPIGEVPDLVIDKFEGYQRSPVFKFSTPRFIASGNAVFDGARHLNTRFQWSIGAQMSIADAFVLDDFIELQNERLSLYKGDVDNAAARLALTRVGVGNWVVQSDNGTAYRLTALPASSSGNWVTLTARIDGLLLLDEYQPLSSRMLATRTPVSGSTATVGGRTIGFGQAICHIALAADNPRTLLGAGSVDYTSGDIPQLVQFSAVELPVISV